MSDARNTLLRIITNINQNAPIGPTGNKFLLSITEEEFVEFNTLFEKCCIGDNSYEFAGNIWRVYVTSYE